jgi:hypothetical protein
MLRTSVPDRLWRQLNAAVKSKTEPAEPWLAKVYRVMIGLEDDQHIFEALRILLVKYSREVVFAFFACRAYEHEIVKHLEVDEEVVLIMQKLIFSTDEVYNKMDHIMHVEKFLNNEVAVNSETEILIRAGMIGGPVCVIERLRIGHENVTLNLQEMFRQMVTTAYSLGTVVRGNAITSASAQHSQKWYGEMMKTVGMYTSKGFSEEAEDDAVSAIEERVRLDKEQKETMTLAEAGVSLGDILH